MSNGWGMSVAVPGVAAGTGPPLKWLDGRQEALASKVTRMARPELPTGRTEAVGLRAVVSVQAERQTPEQRVSVGGRLGGRVVRIPFDR